MTTRRVLVAGASGVIGRAALEAFGVAPGWDALGISRRPPDVELGRHLRLDLLDPRSLCCSTLRSGPPFTHVVYCALQERPGLVPGWFDRELMQTNRRMLASLLDALEPQGALEHVSLLQGAKAYGAHLHPMRVPGREGQARDEHESFYWLQEDLLRERAAHERVLAFHDMAATHRFRSRSGRADERDGGDRNLCGPREGGGKTPLLARRRRRLPLDGVDARLLAQAFRMGRRRAPGASTRCSTSATATSSYGRTSGAAWPRQWGWRSASPSRSA